MKTMKPTENQEEQKICDCPHCTYDREVQAQLKLLPKAQRAFFINLYDNFCKVCEQLQDVMEDQSEENEMAEEEDFDSPYYNDGNPIVLH